MILCGHYKGIDMRIRDYLVTREISVGDYVLTGGELPACIMTDAIVRLIPGAMNDESSALSDSFQDDLLAPPVYTRPAEFNGWRVPDILLSGNHAKIREWQEKVAYERTKTLRPDLTWGARRFLTFFYKIINCKTDYYSYLCGRIQNMSNSLDRKQLNLCQKNKKRCRWKLQKKPQRK